MARNTMGARIGTLCFTNPQSQNAYIVHMQVSRYIMVDVRAVTAAVRFAVGTAIQKDRRLQQRCKNSAIPDSNVLTVPSCTLVTDPCPELNKGLQQQCSSCHQLPWETRSWVSWQRVCMQQLPMFRLGPGLRGFWTQLQPSVSHSPYSRSDPSSAASVHVAAP